MPITNLNVSQTSWLKEDGNPISSLASSSIFMIPFCSPWDFSQRIFKCNLAWSYINVRLSCKRNCGMGNPLCASNGRRSNKSWIHNNLSKLTLTYVIFILRPYKVMKHDRTSLNDQAMEGRSTKWPFQIAENASNNCSCIYGKRNGTC